MDAIKINLSRFPKNSKGERHGYYKLITGGHGGNYINGNKVGYWTWVNNSLDSIKIIHKTYFIR